MCLAICGESHVVAQVVDGVDAGVQMLACCNGTAAVVFQVAGVEVDPVAIEAAEVVDTACLDVGRATGVNQAVCGVVELTCTQV